MLKTAVLCFTLHLLEKVWGGGLQPPALPSMHCTFNEYNIFGSCVVDIEY